MPFDSQYDESTESYDRAYDSADFRKLLKVFFTEGTLASSLQVKPTIDGVSAFIGKGNAFIDGVAVTLDEDEPITFTSTGMHYVYMRLDNSVSQRCVYPFVSKTQSEPLRNANIYDIQLARVNVSSLSRALSNADIVDTRADSTVCGIVTNAVEQISIDSFYNYLGGVKEDFTQEFNAWFDSVKEIVSRTPTGQIVNDIESLKTEFGQLSEDVDDKIQKSQEDVDNKINTLSWKYLGSSAKNTAQTLPTNFKELKVSINCDYKKTENVSFYILKDELVDGDNNFHVGNVLKAILNINLKDGVYTIKNSNCTYSGTNRNSTTKVWWK